VLIVIGLQIENRPAVHPKFEENVANIKMKYFKSISNTNILNT